MPRCTARRVDDCAVRVERSVDTWWTGVSSSACCVRGCRVVHGVGSACFECLHVPLSPLPAGSQGSTLVT